MLSKKIAVLALMILLLPKAKAQQDVQFSQYVFSGLSVNPAYAGYKGDLYLNTIYRQQWSGFPGAPQTGGVSLDGLTHARDERMGVGGQVMWDKLGPQEAVSIYGNYAYRIPLDDEGTRRLCLGIAFGATQYSIDGTKIQYIDGNDPNIPTGKVSTLVPDARFGVYYYTPKFYAGASLLDMFSLNMERRLYFSGNHQFTTFKKTAHLYLTAGWLLDISDNVKLKPSVMVKEDFKAPTNTDINIFLLLANRLWIGGSYRTGVKLWKKEAVQPGLELKNAGSAILEFYATERLRLGYSYDFATNGLAGYQGGTHEISIGLTFPDKRSRERVIGPRYF
jgi:type IX secretion system PorP/SprF family membrane protein